MNRKPIGQTAALLLIGLACLISACKPPSITEGGDCNATDSVEIARVTKVSSSIEMQSQTSEQHKVDPERFTPPAQPDDFYQLTVRRHTRGGCQALAIKSIEKLSKPGISLTPSDAQLYSGAFILDVARNCAHQTSDSCAKDLKLGTDFDLQQQRILLDTILPKSLATCDAMNVATLWPEIKADTTQSRLFACVNTRDKQVKAVEFLKFNVDTKQEYLLLNKLL